MNDLKTLSRRQFFGRSGVNLGAISLWSLLANDAFTDATARPLQSRSSHFEPRAKRVIFLNMNGAPPQLDMFDYKPELQRLSGQVVPASFVEGERFAFIRHDAMLLGSPYKFSQCGNTGTWLSEVCLPHMGKVVDELCFIHSMQTEQFNHAPAALFLFTGFPRTGRPSLGSWLTYGLGSEAADLPSYVVMQSGRGARCGADCYDSGFLPSVHQGVRLRSTGEPVLYLNDPPGVDRPLRRATLDTLQKLNQAELDLLGDPEIQTRIDQYELAFRMQASVPGVARLSDEPKSMHRLYGIAEDTTGFARNCLLARRLIERGVRFVQLNHGEWDLHGADLNIHTGLTRLCRETMQATAALVSDLKSRGLLEDTLLIWGSEFGRTPMLQGELGLRVGRDHHKTFTVWMAGGGVKQGYAHGSTDEIGYRPVKDAVPVHDLQATILHLLGLDHERLTYRVQGREHRLTDEQGHVVHKVMS